MSSSNQVVNDGIAEMEKKHKDDLEQLRKKHEAQMKELKERQVIANQANESRCSTYVKPLKRLAREYIFTGARTETSSHNQIKANQLLYDNACAQMTKCNELMTFMRANQLEEESIELELLTKQQNMEFDLALNCHMAEFKEILSNQE